MYFCVKGVCRFKCQVVSQAVCEGVDAVSVYVTKTSLYIFCEVSRLGRLQLVLYMYEAYLEGADCLRIAPNGPSLVVDMLCLSNAKVAEQQRLQNVVGLRY